MFRKRIFLIIFTLIVVLFVFCIIDNKLIELNEINVSSDNLPEEFNGFKIAHISDLHNAEFGKNNVKLINILKEAKPDIIAITGDVIDSRHTNIDNALEFARNAVEIAPCYYVSGNHESRIDGYEQFFSELKAIGVTVLENSFVDIYKEDNNFRLYGLKDISFSSEYIYVESQYIMESLISEYVDTSRFTVLLTHRPEFFDLYVNSNIDLVLCGHAHGGQVRLPFIGGLIAPDQGFFPEYDSGLYTENNTNMVVSRGLGNSIIPLRINNRPEVILIELNG